MLFDTHTNLHAEQYADDDTSEIIERARTAGIKRFIAICDKLPNWPTVKELSERYNDMWCTVGVHPHYAKDHPDLTAEVLINEAAYQRVCGIGETGLDQHYGYSDLDDQVRCLKEHITAAQETQLPLVIHTREADDLTGDILQEAYVEHHFPLLMHCYTGGQRLADRAQEIGAYFSVSGIVSFKKADDVRSVISSIPRDRVILETDCPYLAPVPHRGRRNEPAFLVDVCRAYAELRDVDQIEIAHETTQNALNLFQRVT